ncbi:MAG: hypothetical protein R3290_11425 [Acidimicrobiia bacterium]|nr:hypothetical protein [Acidimicrobiia bacterium]
MASRRTTRATAITIVVSAAVWVLLLAGIGSSLLTDDPPAESPYASGPRGDDGAAATAGRPIVSAVGFDTGWVEITNTGDAPASLDGWWMCNRPSYFELPAVTLAPGESLLVSGTDEAAIADAVAAREPVATAAAAGSLGSITAGDGEIGLYTSSSFGDPTAIVAYVEWGSSGHGRSGTAVEAGIWTDGDFVDPSGAAVIEATTDAPTSAAGWSSDG